MKRFNIWALVAIVVLIVSVSTAGCTSNVANQTSNTGNQTSSLTSQNMATYESGNFTIGYPSDWTKATDRSTLTDVFVASGKGASVNAVSVNISVGSLNSYSNSRIGTLKNNSNYTLIESGNTTLAGNPAYKAVYTFTYGGGTPSKIMEIWTIKGGKTYTITYQALSETYDANVVTAQKMIDSFQIK